MISEHKLDFGRPNMLSSEHVRYLSRIRSEHAEVRHCCIRTYRTLRTCPNMLRTCFPEHASMLRMTCLTLRSALQTCLRCYSSERSPNMVRTWSEHTPNTMNREEVMGEDPKWKTNLNPRKVCLNRPLPNMLSIRKRPNMLSRTCFPKAPDISDIFHRSSKVNICTCIVTSTECIAPAYIYIYTCI